MNARKALAAYNAVCVPVNRIRPRTNACEADFLQVLVELQFGYSRSGIEAENSQNSERRVKRLIYLNLLTKLLSSFMQQT